MKFLRDVLVDVVVVVILVVLIRSFLIAPFRVDGPSMCDTFNSYEGQCLTGVGEFILTSRLPRWELFGWKPDPLERGDVVIFQNPYGAKGDFFIKRVIGLPGETVKVENGVVLLKSEENFVQLEEPYLNETNKTSTFAHRSYTEEFVVPEGKLFVMGDNRTSSSDSRRCFQNLGCDENHSPFLDFSNVQGEVKLVIFPLSHFRWIKDAKYSV